MKKIPTINTLLILGTILGLGMSGYAGSNIAVYAEKSFNKYDKLTELADDIDDGDFDDDDINWKKFKNSEIYEDADKDTRNCIKEGQELGDNLADYEILHCDEDDDYFDEYDEY